MLDYWVLWNKVDKRHFFLSFIYSKNIYCSSTEQVIKQISICLQTNFLYFMAVKSDNFQMKKM